MDSKHAQQEEGDAVKTAMLVEHGYSDGLKVSSSAPSANPFLYISKVLDLYRSSAGIILGNFLECYDWSLFGYLERLMTSAFFGTSSATWFYFAVPFVARPLGSLIFGWLAALSGRKICLIVTVSIMGCSTFLQGCLVPGLPGMIAAQTLLRIAGGISAGGEAVSCVTYMSEVGEQKDGRLLAAAMSIPVITGSLAFLTATGVGLLLFLLTPEEQLLWGWRLPFLATAPFAIICVYMRCHVGESPEWEKLQDAHRGDQALEDSSRGKTYGTLQQGKQEASAPSLHDLSLALLAFLITLPSQMVAYLPMLLASWLRVYLNFSAAAAMWVAFLSKLVSVMMVIPVAFIADQHGGAICVMSGMMGLLMTVLPSILVMLEVATTTSDQSTVWLAFASLGVIMPFFGTFLIPAELIATSLFPAAKRSQMLGICGGCRSVAVGFTPALFMALSKQALWLPWLWFAILLCLGMTALLGLSMGVRRGNITVHQRPWLF